MFARDALRIAIATERSGLQFYTRAASLTRDARGRSVFQKLATEEKEHLGTLEKRYSELLAKDPQLESRPTFLFFKGAANGLFAAGAERLGKGVNDLEALLIGIKCERGSHNFFKKYGDRFEDSEGKQIFLEFADEEREHLDLLISEYRALRKRQGGRPRPRAPLDARRREVAPLIDLHTHTTASDGRCTPAELVARAASAGVQVLSVTDHDTTAACAPVAAACARGRHRVRARHRDHGRRRTATDVHMLGYFIDPDDDAARRVPRRGAPHAHRSASAR